jgi:cell division protein FtsL
MQLRKSSLITKLLILTLVIYAIVTIVTLQPQIRALKDDNAKLSEAVVAAKQTNLELTEDIASLDTDEAVMEIARERLNFVLDGEVVFINGVN